MLLKSQYLAFRSKWKLIRLFLGTLNINTTNLIIFIFEDHYIFDVVLEGSLGSSMVYRE